LTASFVTSHGAVSNPSPTSVNVSNSGTGGMLMFTASSDSPWLNVTPDNGTAPQTLQISVALGTLTSAVYTGHITVTDAGAQGSPATITVTFTVGTAPSNAAFWRQWGANPQHGGMVSVAGQSLTEQLASIVYDPFVPQEKAENAPIFGEAVLTVHYQAPLTDGNDLYMMMKTGHYVSCSPAGAWSTSNSPCGPNTWSTMIWNEARFSWIDGVLTRVWIWPSDWKPVPNSPFGGPSGWEPVFHPVDANNFIYAPGAGGTIWKLNKGDGSSASHINPFSGNASVVAANTFVASPLTADSSGNIYYNVIEINPTGADPWVGNDVAGAWLVKVTSGDVASTVSYATLVPGAPPGNAITCASTFFQLNDGGASLLWPPATTSSTPTQRCGSQRPGLNIAPAVSADGTVIYTASVAHYDSQVAYMIAVNSSDLSPKWATSLQNIFTDGCGVLLPIAASGDTTEANSCRFGTTVGVDPTTNANGSGSIPDQASSSPTALPDGVAMGVLDNYNYARGHLLKFDASGNFKAAFGFGWDSTAAVYTHDATYSVVIKDNHYGASAYCGFNNPVCAGTSQMYYITQLDPNMNLEWRYQSTNTESCTSNPTGPPSCVSDHPNGFEWCINAPAIDADGNVYVNSEDGNIYLLAQPLQGSWSPSLIIPITMTPGGNLFLNLALGAAYTPLSIGSDGELYTQNDGEFFVVGI
jgi:hypothetical protein